MSNYITIDDIIDIDDVADYDKSELFQYGNAFFKVSVTGDEPRYENDYEGVMHFSIHPNYDTIGEDIIYFSQIIRNFAVSNNWFCNMDDVAYLDKYNVKNMNHEIESINNLIAKLLVSIYT